MSADVSLARSFGRVADTYHRVRPDYSRACLDRAQEVLELDRAARVLDLAAGTGRLTRELAERFAQVVAVEPDDAMRALIADGEALAGSAEAIPLGDASVDAVFVGEAFHWFDARVAIGEIARVLRPRGGLALISNLWWETEPALPQAALDILSVPYNRSGRPRTKVETWPEAFADSPFEPIREEAFVGAITLDRDALLELYSTTSSLAALAHDERSALLARVLPMLDGAYRLPIRHELRWTRLA